MEANGHLLSGGRRVTREVSVSSNTLHLGDEDFETPYVISFHRQYPDHVLLLFGVSLPPLHPYDDVDVPLENPARNVLSIDYDAAVRWQIQYPPDEIPEDRYSGEESPPHYCYLLDVDGTLTVRHTNTYRYELDPATGDLGNAVPDNRLTVGSRTRHFPYPVKSITEIDDRYVVLLVPRYPVEYEFEYEFDGAFEDCEEVYCLDRTGAVLWGRSGSYVSVYREDDELWMDQHYEEGGLHKVDPETGEILYAPR